MKWCSYCLVGLILFSLVIAGCGSSNTIRSFDGKRAIKVPPGVTPIVAARADSIAAGLFVSLKNELAAEALFEKGLRHYEVSDSLWRIIDEARKSPVKSVSKEDSLAAVKQAIPGALQLIEAQRNIDKYKRTQEQRLIIQASYNLKEAQKYLEQSLQLNPFNTQVQIYLAYTYKLLAAHFPKEMTYDKALHLWGALARLEPGDYLHFFNLANTYYAMKQWSEALANYKKCEEILVASAEVNPQRVQNPALPVESTMDTTTRFLSVYWRAQAAIKLLDSQEALSALHHAKELTKNPQNLSIIDTDIQWINWDDGNIPASVWRDSARVLSTLGNFDDAGKIYEKMLNGMLKTQHTRDEISWTYAMIEYTNLNRKASAVSRLLEVIKAMPKDETGAPLDTIQQNYFDAYGTMCYNLGIDTLRSDRKLAYTYFSQAAEIHWKGRGKSFLRMADLSRANPTLMIANAEKALALSWQLDADELQNLYKLLVDGYRRLNQTEKAKYYFEKLRLMQ
ncbi:MAG: hypothetical protein ONB44_23740 [candidate division KSB1 bacterium]|nr:hypothetical protein [candidate division KSB1 bacterium]MDZ7305156.1 hypothetical protein [candidate division KSB1 bacterium]MDZ7314240.1 hypothetical protein [candidate division KSB1 bacterium]